MKHTSFINYSCKITDALVSAFLLANALIWYLASFNFLRQITISKFFSNDILLCITTSNFFAFFMAALVGILVIEHFKKRVTFIKYWLLIGLIISSLFSLINLNDFIILTVISSIVGAYFGIGLPTVAGYFAACTEYKNRAKFAGVIILLIVLLFPTITLVGISNIIFTSGVLIIWLTTGLIFITLSKPSEKKLEKKDQISYKSVFSNKTFLLYIIPWLMFSLINDLTSEVIDNYFAVFPQYFSDNHFIFVNLLAGGFAIILGILADKKGRKRLALIGFALLGSGYAALGLFYGNFVVAWFYVFADGIAWGAFTTLFIITLWGDIAQDKNSEKYYVIGVLPYLFSNFAGASLGAYIAENIVSTVTVFSFASFFLFAATLPLFYAPETIPEKVMKDRELRNYIENAKKIEREATKRKIQKTKKEENRINKKARELAEKYY